MQYERFESWADVVEYAKTHGHVWYHAPFDSRPTKLEARLPKRKPRNSCVPGDGWKTVIKLVPHAALETDPFWVFSDHLAHMRRYVYGPMRGIAVGSRVTCRYREMHVGTLLAHDDPRAWEGSGAFGPGLPDADAVRAHVAKCIERGDMIGAHYPVLWDFGKVYWDTDIRLSDR